MTRDQNAPRPIGDTERTVRCDSPVLVAAERDIANTARWEKRRAVLREWFVLGGAVAGYLALVIELLR